MLAGTATAVGLFAASSMFGPIIFLALYAALSLFAVVMVWGLTLEFGTEPSTAVRIGLCAVLAVMVLAGPCEIHPPYGLLVAVALGLTSPAALGLLARARRARCRSRNPATGVLVDPAMLNRRFEEIVSRLEDSDHFPGS